MTRNGALEVKIRKTDTAEESERFGLELSEYQQILNAPGSVDLSEQENRETRAATELMRWAGLRISDAHKFNDSEIVRNESNHGWNAHFIMKKTKKRCTSSPWFKRFLEIAKLVMRAKEELYGRALPNHEALPEAPIFLLHFDRRQATKGSPQNP